MHYKLSGFDISHTNVTGIYQFSSAFSDLKIIDLSNNDISRVDFAFENLRSLQFDLRNNNILSLPVFGTLLPKSLRILCGWNYITELNYEYPMRIIANQ